MKEKWSAAVVMILAVCLMSTVIYGCGPVKKEEKKQVSLIIKTPPIGLGKVPGVGDVEVYDLLLKAAEKFQEQYDKYDVTFEISRYNYPDEMKEVADKYGTEEAVDMFYSGSWNTPVYAANGWLAPLDDMIDEKLRADIDEKIWEQNTMDGKVYVMPYQQLQTTLMVNKTMMENAGLEEYIPGEDTVANWSTDDFDIVFRGLKDSIAGENQFAFMMYAVNSQGDNHIMTLLRSHGGTLYDREGNFAVNTPEGIQALRWIKELDEQGYTPKGAENLELLDCVNLFNNGQLAVCVGNLTNLWDAWNHGLDVFLVNFPSMDGNGYAVSSSNGFCVFDNGDEDRIEVAKDFIRFIYSDEELMKYTLGTLPVSRSITEKYQGEVRMLKAYGDNAPNIVDNIQGRPGWQRVRDVFYLNIRDLLLGHKTPEETAESIDETCNAALEQGREEALPAER